jgi:hypothetical protein
MSLGPGPTFAFGISPQSLCRTPTSNASLPRYFFWPARAGETVTKPDSFRRFALEEHILPRVHRDDAERERRNEEHAPRRLTKLTALEFLQNRSRFPRLSRGLSISVSFFASFHFTMQLSSILLPTPHTLGWSSAMVILQTGARFVQI